MYVLYVDLFGFLIFMLFVNVMGLCARDKFVNNNLVMVIILYIPSCNHNPMLIAVSIHNILSLPGFEERCTAQM